MDTEKYREQRLTSEGVGALSLETALQRHHALSGFRSFRVPVPVTNSTVGQNGRLSQYSVMSKNPLRNQQAAAVRTKC